MEPKTYKEVLSQSYWIEDMQEELNEFEHLGLWELVPRPNQVMVITLKWIFKMSMMGKISFFLGLQISQSHRGVFINQSKYALKSLKRYGFESCDPVDTPIVEKYKLDEDREGKAVDPSYYRGMIGTLLYLTASRPDLQFPICMYARTMATIIEQQVALDEALVPSIQRLRIGRSNFRLPSDIQSKESNLQVVYDVLRRCPFFKAFLVTAYPWRSFRAVINKCLTGKSSGFDSFRLSHAQILWGLYHSRNIDYAFLIWEDFMYQVEHKNHKKSNEMYYPRFTKVILHHFMSKDLSIPRRNKVNWHYVRDDIIFLTIKVVSRHQNTQQYGAMLPIELTNKEIRNSKAYKEYYACAIGEAAPKPKASARKKRSGSDTSITPPNAITTPTTTVVVTLRLTATLGGSGTYEGTGSKPGVPDVPSDYSKEEISWNSSNDEYADAQEKDRDDDEGNEKDEITRPGLIFHCDPIWGCYNINQGRGLTLSQDIEESHMTLTPVNPDGQQESSSVSSQFVTSMLNPTSDACMESIFATASSPVAPLQTSTTRMTPSTIATITIISHAPIPPTRIPSDVLQNLPTFNSVFRFEDRLKSLEANFLEYIQTNPFVEAVSNILADLLEMELKKILIEKMEGNKSIQCFDEQRNLYKVLVEAYEADKIIIDTYEERVILKRRRDDDDDDQGEGPSAGSDRGSKRQREGKEPKSASAPLQTATKSAGRSTTGSKSRQASASESAFAEEPVQTTSQIEEPSHLVFETGVEDQPIVQSSQKPPTPNRDWNKTLPAAPRSTLTWISELAKQADSRSSFNELLDTALDFSNFIMNRFRVDTLTPELLAGPTYELIKGSCNSLIELEYHLEEVYKATTDQLDWVNPEEEDHCRHGSQDCGMAQLQASRLDYGKLSNLTIEERFTFNVSLRMFTRSIVIQRRVEDLQLGVKSYQKRLNLTKPDTYRSDLKRREAYTSYSNPRGFNQNKDKKNRLMWIDELHKFNDGTLNDVRNALDERLKGIRMQYLPQTIWRKGDKDRAVAMIQVIDKMLKTMRIMRSLERFVGGRLYEGNFRMLQRTI
nr:copia protein [Tanacetum cinerariifolium]